jgi:putative spermidine/putrescine transport system substrate-binding protein
VRQRWVLGFWAATVVVLAVSGCSGSNSNSGGAGAGTVGAKTGDAAKAQSAAALGGMDALVAAAKAEGTLNIIAVPRTWVGYGGIIDAFSAKYGIKINSENEDGSSGDEINAIKTTVGQASAPDVIDILNSYAVSGAQAGLYAPYKVTTWNDIPDSQKDASGLWYGDYGGYVSIGCNAAKVGGTCPKTIKALDNPAYRGLVSIAGDPTSTDDGFESVWAAALANGGSSTAVQPGIDFFKKLNTEGILNKTTKVTTATMQSGITPIVLDFDYLNVSYAAALKASVPPVTWTTTIPTDGLVSSYQDQAISVDAAHPAAARLWEEFLYSQATPGGQNGWLKGFARPVELPAMQKNGSVDAVSLAMLPVVNDPTPFDPTADQIVAARTTVTQNWAAAIAGVPVAVPAVTAGQ